jgi:hypothetical protein
MLHPQGTNKGGLHQYDPHGASLALTELETVGGVSGSLWAQLSIKAMLKIKVALKSNTP